MRQCDTACVSKPLLDRPLRLLSWFGWPVFYLKQSDWITSRCACVLLFPLQVDEGLSGQVHDAYILKEITGSDHVPLGIVIKKSDA